MSRSSLVGRLARSSRGTICALFLLALVLCALFAPWIAPYDYAAQKLSMANTPPSAAHWLGTDEFGRDLLSRIIQGARTSLSVSVLSIALSVLMGATLGAAAGYFGGVFDKIVTVFVDLTWSFPEILLALILIAILGPGLHSTAIAIAIAYLAQFTRLTRAQVMALKGELFVDAAVTAGARPGRVLFLHLLPNAMTPVIVAGMLATGDAIVLEATLGFFGLGAQPPVPSWGAMMSSGTAQIFIAPWIIIFPGLVIATAVIAINVFGDALIEALDIRRPLRDG